MLRWPFGTGLPRWASVKACSTKASPMTTPWPRTFSAAPNVSSFICVGMSQAGLLKRIFSPISRPFTICCARILPLTGSLRSLLNCVCVIQLLLKPKDLPHFCDLFHFLRFLLSIFSGRAHASTFLSGWFASTISSGHTISAIFHPCFFFSSISISPGFNIPLL